MKAITEHEALKINAINLATHHRRTCDGQTCNISLSQIYTLLKRAGIELTDEERRVFL